MAMEFPFHIFQTDEHVAITFEWQQVYRLIYTDGEPPMYAGIESWMGNSRGRWEGDVLVVEVADHNDQTWFDAAGNFHSNALLVTEKLNSTEKLCGYITRQVIENGLRLLGVSAPASM